MKVRVIDTKSRQNIGMLIGLMIRKWWKVRFVEVFGGLLRLWCVIDEVGSVVFLL